MLNLEFSPRTAETAQRFADFFSGQPTAVTTAAPAFDAELYARLGAAGMLGLRAPENMGGSGEGLMAAAVAAEAMGRHLAPVPLIETLIATRLIANLNASAGAELLAEALAGRRVITLALHEVRPGIAQMVPAGAVADAVIACERGAVFVRLARGRAESFPSHAGQPIASMTLDGTADAGDRIELAQGCAARETFEAAIEEWKLLTAAALNGLARRALELAAGHARDRVQFGRPIGSFQGVAHPLANCATDVDAAQLFTWQCIQEIALARPAAAALVDLTFWWSSDVADRTARRALHTFGGYGVLASAEIQRYFRHAKGMALVLGDPVARLREGARRMWFGATAPLPPADNDWLDFDFGAEADALASETRAVLDAATTPEWRARAGWSMDSFDVEVHRQLGDVGLMHPSWPVEWGGRGAHPFAAALALSTWEEFSVTGHAQAVSHFVGTTLQHFGSAALKREVLEDIGRGLKTCSLGYSEPESGSDIFAATTRARRDPASDGWIISGRKMFTSGANRADYIFLLTRTDQESAKHEGITMFLIPADTPGVRVEVIDTMQGERTAATFYDNVRVADHYRVGDVNGGQRVLAAALMLEQGGSFKSGCHRQVEAAVEWLRAKYDEELDESDRTEALARLAKAKTLAMLTDLLAKRAIFTGVTQPGHRTAHGSMNKLFRSESYQQACAELMEVTAPDSLIQGPDGVGLIERSHRLAQIYTIYGGSSEIHRSVIAEIALGLPRSR